MPDEILASELTAEHVGRLVRHQSFNGTLLAIEHGGPFPLPDSLVTDGIEPFVQDGKIPRAFTEQLQIQPVSPGYPGREPDPFYAWLVPGETIELGGTIDHA